MEQQDLDSGAAEVPQGPGEAGAGDGERGPSADPALASLADPRSPIPRFTQAEMDARLAALRTKLEQRHAMELGERDLKVAALKLAPELGIADVDVVLANVDRRSITYEDGKPANLSDVLEEAAQRLAEAVGVGRGAGAGAG